jgi:hypothetical protein
MTKRKTAKRTNPIARALRNGQFQPQRVSNKRKAASKKACRGYKYD